MKSRLLLLLIFLTEVAVAQNFSKYGVRLIDNYSYYAEQVKNNPEYEMIDLGTLEGIDFDIRYATKNNFTSHVIYPLASAYARKPVAKALKKANKAFNKLGLKLKIYDAYRPYNATVRFYEIVRDTQYVASPYSGSRHNRGCAVDVTLVELETGEEIEMPTNYDDFSEKAHPDFDLPDELKRKNRDILINTMEQFGFKVYPYEWWHFDYVGWEKFPIMDLSFKALKSEK